MSKLKSLITSLSIFGLVLTNVYADPPFNLRLRFDCPKAADKHHLLLNYGTFIAGEGKRRLLDPPAPYVFIEFKGDISNLTNIPADISKGGYFSTSTRYSPEGIVTCHYTSNLGFQSFEVHHPLTNSYGATLIRARADQIYFSLLVGGKRP
jgi:hypothetical protein